MSERKQMFALVADYGSDGLRYLGIFTTEEKAKAGAFDSVHRSNCRVIVCEVDSLLDD